MEQIKSKNRLFSRTNLLCRASIRKRIAISQFQFQKVQQNEFLYNVHCNFGAFGPEASEFTLLTIAPFAAIRQKLAYHAHAKYLRISWTFLDLLYRFGRRISGDDYPTFIWRSLKGHCYGNQLNLGDVHERRVERPLGLLFASAFDNGLANRKSAFKRFNGNNQATSYPNYTLELPSNNLGVYAVKTCNFCKFARNFTIFIRHVGVSKRIGISQF